MHITLIIIVLIITDNTLLTTNGSFGKILNFKIVTSPPKKMGLLKEIRENFKIMIPFYLTKPV